MNFQDKETRVEFLEKIRAQAHTDGQPLSELEERCLSAALEDQGHTGLKQVEREFPSPEAYDEFVSRARHLIERAVLHEAESRPDLTPQARATLERVLTGRGEAVAGSVISMAVFGRMPGALRAFGIVVLVLPLAAIFGWHVYADLAGGRLPPSSRTPLEVLLALIVFLAVSSVVNLWKKVFAR